MRARPRDPGGARLHDYWQQASKRGTTKEVRVSRVKTGRSSDTRNSGAFTALRCEARTQRGGAGAVERSRLSFSFTFRRWICILSGGPAKRDAAKEGSGCETCVSLVCPRLPRVF